MKHNGSGDDWICLGRIIRAHGIKGALSFKPDNPKSESLRPNLCIQIESRTGVLTRHVVKSYQAGRILSLEGLVDRNIAETFQQSKVYVKRSDFPNLGDDEVYLNDMIGFEVIDQKGEKLGIVEGFSDNTAQTLLVVRTARGDQGMIPFVEQLVKDVDLEAGTIRVDIPDGLFESEKANE